MSLKQFHILFISLAILLLIGFGIWSFLPAGGGGNSVYLACGILSIIIAIGLVGYEMNLLKKMKNLTITTLFLSLAVRADACTMCFSTGSSNQAVALKWGVISLFIILLVVLGTLAKFFLSVAKRSKELSV